MDRLAGQPSTHHHTYHPEEALQIRLSYTVRGSSWVCWRVTTRLWSDNLH